MNKIQEYIAPPKGATRFGLPLGARHGGRRRRCPVEDEASIMPPPPFLLQSLVHNLFSGLGPLLFFQGEAGHTLMNNFQTKYFLPSFDLQKRMQG